MIDYTVSDCYSVPPLEGSIGDLIGGEENPPDDVSLSGEEGGPSDPEDSVECDSSSPPPYTPQYQIGRASCRERV